MDRKCTSRRRFLGLGVAAAAASACGGCALVGSREPDAVARQDENLLRLDQADSAALLGSETSVLVEPEGGGAKIIVVNRGGLFAVSSACTHMGCDVKYDGKLGQLLCPCHGSQYGLDGANIKGPAKKPLKRYDVRAENGRVVIAL